uniref:Uncharacterized protein n=1 Tax=Schistosoma japonicum TaxID=6182 RepID=Q4JL33_SCHJA|nr:unknown [Schistosoma japonicum]
MIVTRRMFLCVAQIVAVLAIFSEYCSLGVDAWGAGDIDYTNFGRKWICILSTNQCYHVESLVTLISNINCNY